MATFSKTQGTTLLSLQSVASNTVVISSAADVTTKMSGTVGIHFGRRSASALNSGVEFRIEASVKSSGDGYWFPLAVFRTALAAVSSEAVSGTVNAGTNVITVADTTGLTERDIIYIDNSTIANSEWGRIKDISAGTSVTIEDNLVNAQTGSTMYDGAELFTAQLDLSSVGRLRLVVDACDTGQAVAVEALMVTADSIG
jgi:hypothetical protein